LSKSKQIVAEARARLLWMAYEEYTVTSTSDQTRRTGRRFWYGVAESFFRRWPLYVLPLLLMVGLGVLQAQNITGQYKSVGVLNVASNPLLDDVSAASNNGAYAFETPSAATTRMINELMRTDRFVRSVAEQAGLKAALDSGTIEIDAIRSRVGASSDGDRLLAITASWTDATTAVQLVNATISEYLSHVLELEVKSSADAEEFWAERKATYEKGVNDAQTALQDYVVQFPPPKIGDRPTEQQLQLQTLTGQITQAQSQVTIAESKIDEARLATQEATGQAGQGLQTVDPPEAANAPESIHRKQALAFALYAFLGVFVLAAMLLLSTLLDRAVRTPGDVDVAAGLPVVATVPSFRAARRRPSKKRDRRELLPTNF
jgi:hypothetical protein